MEMGDRMGNTHTNTVNFQHFKRTRRKEIADIAELQCKMKMEQHQKQSSFLLFLLGECLA